MVKKTREKFIEVARQLFARKGVENTTMNDIANASDKGRRTIYTYFKSKREIFNAVIDNETDELLHRLRHITAKHISARDKMTEYVECRLRTMREIVSRNGSLKAGFFLDVRKVDRARMNIVRHEVSLIADILRQGVESGEFSVSNPDVTATIIANSIQGLDVPFIRNNIFDHNLEEESRVGHSLAELLLNGLEKRD